jgi:hypothetical protein
MTARVSWLIGPLVAALLGAAACGNDDGKVDATPDAGASPVDAGPSCSPIDPKFSVLKAQIFDTVTCNTAAACHGATPQGALLLTGDDATVLAALTADTDQLESRNTYPKRVVAGNPDQSFLWQKLTDPNVPRGIMPLGQPRLDDCQLDAIRAWIQAGALLD